MKEVFKGNLVNSLNAAVEGFLFVVKTERNMRIHFLLALFVLILGIFLDFSRIEIMLLCLTCALVLIAEMINTAMEIVMDYVEASHSEWVGIVKDISAGAVLIASINAIVVGYLLFFRNNAMYKIFSEGAVKVSQSNWHISFILLVVLVGVVIIVKVVSQKGTPFRGGMPSGHSAVAYSVWMLVVLLSSHPLLVFTVFMLAFMVARSRISKDLHSFWEVFIGSVLGATLTVLIYRLLAR